MRSYIFTPRERRVIQAWSRGEKVNIVEIDRLLWRFRTFRNLASDVELYLLIRERLKAKPLPTKTT